MLLVVFGLFGIVVGGVSGEKRLQTVETVRD